MSCAYEQTKRTKLRLYSEFGTYEKDAVHQIIDDAPIVHVSAIYEGSPYTIPTVHWRLDDKVYVHGAVKNRAMQSVAKGSEACLSFTHFEGHVLTRSAFNHAVLYRSVIAFSHGRMVEDLDERRELLGHFVNRIEPGRWDKVRQPTINELKQTGVVEFTLNELSAKILPEDITPIVFPGGEMEVPEDEEATAWIGIVPYSLERGTPVPAQDILDRVNSGDGADN